MNELPIVEEFYTLQGEGFHMGKAAYFIRIGGCDIACRWCDSKISWDQSNSTFTNIDQIVEKAHSFAAKAVVVTGGEPLSFDLTNLCTKLKEKNILTFIETSGAFPLSGEWDWICLSPKKNSPPLDEVLNKANELKIIIYEQDDYLWAEENAKKVSSNCKLYLQPEWSRHKTTVPEIVEYIKTNPKWCISLQAHKFMHIP